MGIFKTISRYGLIPATVAGNLLTAGIEKITGKKYGRQTTKELAETKFGKILGTATVGTAGALAVSVAGAGSIAKGATRLIPETAKGKIIGVGILGLASASPAVAKAVVEFPVNVLDVGIVAGQKIEELPTETKEKAGEFGVGGLLIAGAVGAISGIVAPKMIEKITDTPILPVESKEAIITPTPPITPETVSLEEVSPVKKPIEARRQKITQEVNISVSQQQNKRYKNIILVH